MGIQIIQYSSKVWLPILPCDRVALCLPDVWSDRTDLGFPVAFATVQNAIRMLGERDHDGCVYPFYNPRGVPVAQYEFAVDDSQFGDDPDTDEPWILPCEDILDVDKACLLEKIIRYIRD